eukprot:6035504-Alexandrium_andersonii.AAC.1
MSLKAHCGPWRALLTGRLRAICSSPPRAPAARKLLCRSPRAPRLECPADPASEQRGDPRATGLLLSLIHI